MRFKAFDVVAVPFPFADRHARKRRPALVVSTQSFDNQHEQVILAMITTAKASRWFSDVEIVDWESANLSVPCKVRLKLFTLDKSTIVRHLGNLSSSDQLPVQEMMNQCIAVN